MFRFSFHRLRALIRKEFIQLKRDKTTLIMIIMLPVMQLMLFGYAINMDPKHLSTAVISRDNTFLTRSIVSAFEKSDYFNITHKASSDAQGKKLLQQGRVLFVITIPENFTRDVIHGNRPTLLLQADASDPVSIIGATSAMDGIYQSVAQKEFNGSLAYLQNNATPAFSIQVQKSYNPEGFTRYNIVPGLIGMVLVFTGVMMTSLALTRERERGTMENLMSMPLAPLEIMIGK